MKKLLGLTFILTSMVALSAPQGSEEKQDTMNITATVIQPLTVVATDMNFGKIIQNTQGNANATFTVKGEANENVVVTIPETATLTDGTNSMTVAITTTGTLSGKGSGTLTGGNDIINVKGVLSENQTAHTGTFEGTLVAKVIYN